MEVGLLLGYAFALLIGLSLGLLGGGGSILTVPVLLYFFGYGMKEAVPMSLVVVGLSSLFGVSRHHRAGNVDFRAALAFGPAAIVGSFGGAALALRVSSKFQVTLFAIVMLGAAVAMLLRRATTGSTSEAQAGHPLAMLLLGAAVGVLTGLVGVGGGFLYVPALALIGGVTMRRAVGTSLVLIALSCGAGLVKYVGAITIPWDVVTVFSLLAFVGVVAGSRVAQHVSQPSLRKGFAVFLLVMGVFVLWRGEGKGAVDRSATPPTGVIDR